MLYSIKHTTQDYCAMFPHRSAADRARDELCDLGFEVGDPVRDRGAWCLTFHSTEEGEDDLDVAVETVAFFNGGITSIDDRIDQRIDD